MRIETTYYAFDDTEFNTAAECLAYEEACNGSVNNAVAFFDKDLNRLTTEKDSIQGIAEDTMFMKVMDGEKAAHLMKWLYDTTGVCIVDGLPDTLETGDIYAWSSTDYEWYSPIQRMREYQGIVDAIEKAVGAG